MPLFQSESECEALGKEIRFIHTHILVHLHGNKTSNFHIKCFALGLNCSTFKGFQRLNHQRDYMRTLSSLPLFYVYMSVLPIYFTPLRFFSPAPHTSHGFTSCSIVLPSVSYFFSSMVLCYQILCIFSLLHFTPPCGLMPFSIMYFVSR